eukprot:gene9965-10120_t
MAQRHHEYSRARGGRLGSWQQLDTQMHKMMQEKHRRSEEVKADQAAVNKIEETMQTHIQPCLDRLNAEIQHKQELRDRVSQQLESDMAKFKDMEREAAALISKARHANSRLMGFFSK